MNPTDRNLHITRASADDLDEITRIFEKSFSDSISDLFGSFAPNSLAVRDLFELILRVEPKSMFVAKSDQVVGYAIGLVDMSNLRIQAIAGGDLLKWTRRWWHGEYGVRRFPVRNLVWDKLALLLSPGSLKQQFVRTKGMTGQILSIAVSPEVRGKSIGRSLLQACLTHFTEQEIRRVKLEVRPDNKAALTIYEKEGFVQVGEYKDGRGTWLVMMRDLQENTRGDRLR